MIKLDKGFMKFYLLLISLIFGLFLATFVSAGCCIFSTDATAYCMDFDDSQDAIAAGCNFDGYVDDICEFTECAYFGCCHADCTWKQKGECMGSVFSNFESCDTVSGCSGTCCKVGDGEDAVLYDNVGEAACDDQGGTFFYESCSEISIGLDYYRLSGTVKDSDDNVLPDVQVFANTYRTISGGDGGYVFNSVAEGDYQIISYLAGYQHFSPANDIFVRINSDTVQDIVMVQDPESRVTIEGRVEDTIGNPIQGASIVLDNRFTANSDTDGYYTMVIIISEGSYDLSASKNGFREQTIQVNVQPGGLFGGMDFTLAVDAGTSNCGNGILDTGEECDYPHDFACPGKCGDDGVACQCPLTCEELGYYCADIDYQCSNVNGHEQSQYNEDCQDYYNLDKGVCCDEEPIPLTGCIYGESPGFPTISETYVAGSGGSFCRCGDEIIDVYLGIAEYKYCCLVDGQRVIQSSRCVEPGILRGLVRGHGSPMDGVTIMISSTYHTVSNDSSGKNYGFNSIAPGHHTLIASRSGYMDYIEDFELDAGDDLIINFDMMPRQGMDAELQMDLSAVKGQSHVEMIVTIDDTSAISKYVIRRNGLSFQQKSQPLDLVEIFIDYGAEWDTTYVYNVSAYDASGILIDSVQSSITTGHSACGNVLDTYEFCVTENCYSSKSAQDCPFLGEEYIFNYRVKCNNNNRLVLAVGYPDSFCENGACVEMEGGYTICTGEGNDACETLGMPPYSSGNIFGLYYDEAYMSETCMLSSGKYKYCYYDYYYSNVLSRIEGSYTIVDQCLSCDPAGFCYDYQSEEACLADNCRFGLNHDTQCKWEDTLSELGKGLCYSDDVETTRYCSICDIENPVFYNTECAQDVCSLLGYCVSAPDDERCIGCTQMTSCTSFNNNPVGCKGNSEGYMFIGEPQLSSPGTQCNSSTSIEYSDDACGVGLCKYIGGMCIKDGNDDGIDDCGSGDDSFDCMLDISIPTTSMISQNFISIMEDMLSFEITSYNVPTTFYCFSDIGSYCCPDKIAENGGLVVPNPDYPELDGVETEKMIWFYSRSEYGNPEEIKGQIITIDNTPPKLDIQYDIVDSSLGRTLSDLQIRISAHEGATNCIDYLDGIDSGTMLSGDTIYTNEAKTVIYPGLSDGSYIYHIECEDSFGNLNSSVFVNIEIDRIKLIENIYPNFITLATSLLDFSIETEQKQYDCYYSMIEPNAGGDEPYISIDEQAGRYYYSTDEIELYDSEAYLFEINCYDGSDIADVGSMFFTVDELAPSTDAYVFDGDGFEVIDPDGFYKNPLIKIECIDPVQGPPREFGCSMIDYCLSTTTCNPSVGITENSDVVEFRPNVESGDYYLCFRSYDAGGNQENTKCREITIDIGDPIITITSPPDNHVLGSGALYFTGGWNDEQRPTVLAKVLNDQSGQLKFINSVTVTGSSGYGTYFGDALLSDLYGGLNYLVVTAVDPSNNREQEIVSFYLDIYSPDFIDVLVYGELPYSQEYELIVINAQQDMHHEYGYNLMLKVNVNDEKYTDQHNSFGTDVMINATIFHTTASSSEEVWFVELSYNESTGYYEAIVDATLDITLDIGNYNIEYLAADRFWNIETYIQDFEVEDKLSPLFEIIIYDEEGNNVTDVMYGSYTVDIISSEPIDQIHSLNFTFNGIQKHVPLFINSGTTMTGTFQISPRDMDFMGLIAESAEFEIYAEDLHSMFGDEIIKGKNFYITTIGPMQPIIFNPDTLQSSVFYSSEQQFSIQGIVFKEFDKGLKGGRIQIMVNKHVGVYADGNWQNEIETTTASNVFKYTWDYQQYGDTIIYKANNKINLFDYDSSFVVGRYIGFQGNPRLNKKLYRIVSKTFTNSLGGKSFYDIVLDPSLEGYEGFNDGDQFEDIINIYETDSPDGWFSADVAVDSGNNFFYVRAFDGMNEGMPSVIFNIIKDDQNPVLLNTSPYDGTKTGNLQVPIYAWIDSTFSNVSEFTMSIKIDESDDGSSGDGSSGGAEFEEVAAEIEYNSVGEAKIYYPYGGELSNGKYTVSLIVYDMARNVLNHEWQFEIDDSMPTGVDINPKGVISDTTPMVKIDFVEESVVDELLITGGGLSNMLDITDLLTYAEGIYKYQLTVQQTLIEGDYEIILKARKKINNDFGAQGQFFEYFTVDTTPPLIIEVVPDPVHSPGLPAILYITTDEPALCRYGFNDVAYDQLAYSSSILDFSDQHVIQVFDMITVNDQIYIKCKDRAENKMVNPRIVDITIGSLIYPPPGIYLPEDLIIVVRSNTYPIIGSTFDNPDSLLWIPGVNVIIAKSSNLFSANTEFEKRQMLTSFESSGVQAFSGEILDINLGDNSIIVRDTENIFKKDRYIDFPNNRRNTYKFFKINSVLDLSGTYGEDVVKVAFSENLPSGLTEQILYVYDQEAPPGWFSHNMGLNNGNNFFYAAGMNSFGEGEKTAIYNVIKDNVNPRLYDEHPRNGEIIGETDVEVWLIADGIYSNIADAYLTLDMFPVNFNIESIKDFESKISHDADLNNGLHSISMVVYDEAGNSDDLDWSFTVDTDVPSRPTIIPYTYINDTTPFIEIGFWENVVINSAKIAGDANIDITSNLESVGNKFTYDGIQPLAEGAYIIEVRAVKSVTQSPSYGFWYDSFWVDLTPPVITSIPSEIKTKSIPLEFLMITNEDAKCKFSESDKGYYQMENDFDYIFQKNHYVQAYTSTNKGQIYIRCRDIAGNVMAFSNVVVFNEPAAIICGDGVITYPEECDGTNWGSITSCMDFNPGFNGGDIDCKQCRFDSSGCYVCQDDSDCDFGESCVANNCIANHCLNGIKDADEDDVDCGGIDCASCSGGVCGDGIIDLGESCEGEDLSGMTCSDFSCDGGVLGCMDCEFDLSGCSGCPPPGACGDNVISLGEQCDGDDLGSITCIDIDDFQGGTLSCTDECSFDTFNCIAPKQCGNNRVDLGETCDGIDFGPVQECCDLSDDFICGQGSLTCMASCHFDTSMCTREIECGNEILEPGEECEGNDLDGNTCADFGLTGEGLRCENCQIITDDCLFSCGDTIINPGEECDGDTDGKGCNDLGFIEGTLLCDNDICKFDTTLCIPVPPECGNGIIELGEQCEGNDLAGKSCQDFGLNGAGLKCIGCQYSTDDCYIDSYCGNDVVEPGEQCDGLFFDTLCSEWDNEWEGGPVIQCIGCQLDFSACEGPVEGGFCGDSEINLDETCDINLNFDKDCTEFGLTEGVLSCGSDCQWDTSQCLVADSACGNDVIENTEQCEGDNNGFSCTDFDGFLNGDLDCVDCHLDTIGCLLLAVCGNTEIEQGEDCDSSLHGKDCTFFDDFTGGNLGCSNIDCHYDTIDCIAPGAICGNGVIEVGETCEPLILPYELCSEVNSGFCSGYVSCVDCQLATDSCITCPPECGNGAVEPQEECDSGISEKGCKDFDDFDYGNLKCGADCMFDTSLCKGWHKACGNEILDSGESCDKGQDITRPCTLFDRFVSGEVVCSHDCTWQFWQCRKEGDEPGCGNGIIDAEIGEQCEEGMILKDCIDLGFNVDALPGCFPVDHEEGCMYDTMPCGSIDQCKNGDTILCNDLGVIYIYGEAVCVENFYDMDYCFSSELPILIMTDLPNEVSTDYINITGTVSGTRSLEIYINGAFVETVNYTFSSEHEFLFIEVNLPKNTQTSNGINEIRLIAYGGVSEIKTVFTKNIMNIQGPLAIKIIEPVNNMTKSEYPTISINTSLSADCSISYMSDGYMENQDFTTFDNKVHHVTLVNPLNIEEYNTVTIICNDLLNNEFSTEADIFVDINPPAILDVKLIGYQQVEENTTYFKKITIFDALNNRMIAISDSEVKCRYGINNDNYAMMIDYDDGIDTYAKIWHSNHELEASSQAGELSIYTICEDKAGWLSDTYKMVVIVDPYAPLVITNLNPSHINLIQPTLRVKTNRMAECSMTYLGNDDTEDMSRYVTDTGEEHLINIDEFSHLEFEHGNVYEFRVECDPITDLTLESTSKIITITADFEAPIIEILAPYDGALFTYYEILVEISTEIMSTVQIYVNEELQGENVTLSGSMVLDAYLELGANTITIVVTDQAGNTHSKSITVYYSGNVEYPQVIDTFPEDEETVASVSELKAWISTAYGVELSLVQTVSELKDEYGYMIIGELDFASGDAINPTGNLTFTLAENLADGKYTWVLQPVDEFGNAGNQETITFTVSQAVPVIYLTDPIIADTNSLTGNLLYHTSEQTFTLSGRVTSVSRIIESYYKLGKEKEELNLVNGRFEKIITLDDMREGNSESYSMIIYVMNDDGFSKELQFNVLYDLEAPEAQIIIN